MAVSSGAGASVASGASYQARVAAYFVVCHLAGLSIPFMARGQPTTLSMETNEAIDDLQVSFANGARSMMQAKRSLSFSTLPNSELASVFEQFVIQSIHAASDKSDDYYLVTSSDSSKRVTGDMKAALDAARTASQVAFEQDQPKSIVCTYNELLGLVHEIQIRLVGSADDARARALLAKSSVIVLDIDPRSSLEQAIVMALHSSGYTAPFEMWGKIIADCLELARRMSTVKLSYIEQNYSHLKAPVATPLPPTKPNYLQIELTSERFEVGRELVVARALTDLPFMKQGTIGAIEFYRFDDSCKPRLRFRENRVIFGNGLELELWARFATWVGLERFIAENEVRLAGEEIVILPMSVDDDLEKGLCAVTHRHSLDAAARRRNNILCVHCELPVTESMCPIVEFGEGRDLCFGFSHRECLVPSDRILGRADSVLFRENPELVNFDITAWFRAAHRGHGVFFGIEASGQAISPVIWGGTPSHEDASGKFMVVSVLDDGTEELVCKRGQVQRFTKQHAVQFAERLGQWVQQSRASGDPLCYSDQSRAFSRRSVLLQQLGGKEKIHAISTVIARPYEAKEAARYPGRGNWYAPLLILREAESLTPIVLTNAVPAISDPLTLGQHLRNWRAAGFDIPPYEIECLLDDAKVDQLIDMVLLSGLSVILDPVISEDGSMKLVRGHPILTIEHMQSEEFMPER